MIEKFMQLCCYKKEGTLEGGGKLVLFHKDVILTRPCGLKAASGSTRRRRGIGRLPEEDQKFVKAPVTKNIKAVK